MPKREKIAVGQIYHICNRGVDKRKIFLEDADYFRAIHDLFEFNDEKPAINVNYSFSKQASSKYIGFGNQYISGPRKLLVEVLAFCLMPNHYHLLLKPLIEGGLELFMRKMGGGYANYFNKKYKRLGVLFQGRYKLVPVTNEAHFIHLPFYIHLNPLDLNNSGWRKRELNNSASALSFLKKYRWSSHLDYLGQKNFPSVTQRSFLLEFFGGTTGYKNSLEKWLKEISLKDLTDVALEPIY